MPKAMDVNGRWPKPSTQNRSDMQKMCRYLCCLEGDFKNRTTSVREGGCRCVDNSASGEVD